MSDISREFFSEFWPSGLPDGFFVEFRDLSKSPPPSAFRTNDQLETLRDAPAGGFIAFSVAATNERRPIKEDTARLVPAVWVDLDIVSRADKQTTDPAQLQERLKPLVQTLGQMDMPPSAVIYSGGGLHLYWRLDRPTRRLDVVRQVNEHLVNELLGDRAAVNVSRVMRMPGSINDRLASAVTAQPVADFPHWQHSDYTLEELMQLDGHDVREQMAAIGAASAKAPAQQLLEAIDDLPGQRDWRAVEEAIRAGDNWHTNVRDRVASMTQQGVAEADILDHAVKHWTLPGYSEDDTRRDVLPLVRTSLAKWPLPVAAAAPDEPAEQGLTYESWRSLWPFDQRANKFVDLAGDFSLLTHQAWELRNQPFVDVTVEEDGKTKRRKWVDRYRDDPNKIIVDGADVLPYEPMICGTGPVRRLNLWRDNPAAQWADLGDPNGEAVQLYKELLLFLCDGREDYRQQILHWAAVSLFCMDQRIRYALLCISHEKGTGKSLAFEILRRLHHEPHTASLESLSQLTGRFTGWMQAKTLCVVQETTDASQGRWGAMESLKSAISEEYVQVERKHADPQMTRHWTRFAFLGNSLESLPFDSNERRIFAVVCEAKEPREPEFYTSVASHCLSEQGLADLSAYLRPFADKPLPLRAPASDVWKIQDSLIPPFVDMLNEAADGRGAVALRGADMNRIVRHLTGQSLRGGGQSEQLKRGGWRAIRTTIAGQNGRFWVNSNDMPDSIDVTLADAIVDGSSVWP